MRRTERELAQDFGQRIRKARAGKGWSQEELARKLSEKVNVVKSSESGRRPTDAVISIFERVLNVVLMDEYTPEEHRQVGSKGGGGFTLGDYLNGAR
jgi:putative transcription factor